MRILIVANPASGGGDPDTVDRVVTTITELDTAATLETAVPVDPAAAQRLLRDRIDGGVNRVIVVGGDGMVHLAVQALARTEVVLGVVASGTGNDFATALGLPADPVHAASAALAEPARIDLLHVDAEWVASVATGGFSGDVNARANRMRRPRGSSRYSVATIAELPRLHTRRLELRVDGEVHRFDAVLVALANTGLFGGGMAIAPDARPDDGTIDVTVVGEVGRIRLLRFFRRVFAGTHMALREVTHLRGERIEVRFEDSPLWGDGEPLHDVGRPVVVEVVPEALWVAGARL